MPGRRSKTSIRTTTTLTVRLDRECKDALVRAVTVGQARKEVSVSSALTISLSAAEQLAFWTALNGAPKLTAAQKKLGKIMRGES